MAYGVLGWAFDALWRLAGYRGPAMIALQTLNSLLGAAAAGVFFTALRRAGCRRAIAAAGAVGLAVSHGFWLWSLEAQVYPVGLLFMALALREALAARPRPERLGLFMGLAMLGHVGHAMFAPAALFCLVRRFGAGWRRAAARWAGAAFATVLAAYAWAAVFCVRPRSFEDLRVWLLGSAALKLDKSFAWHGRYSWGGFREWAAMSARVFSDYSGWSGLTRASGLALGLLCLALAGAGARWAWRRDAGFAVKLCALWLAAYATLFLSWEPFTMVYRLGDLLPLWLLISLALERRAPTWAAAALAASLGFFNGWFGIRPHARPQSNPTLMESYWLADAAPDRAWVVASGLGQVYYPYFAHRRPLNMRYWDYRLPELAVHLDALAARGERVFVTEATLSDGGWKAWFAGYGLLPRATRGANVLYELKRKGSRAEARRRG
jgi:hypothetical protein